MDPHRLAEERSVAYHTIVAARLQHEPHVLETARARVADWLRSPGGAPVYAQRWSEILDRNAAAIAAFLTERTELADELRQSSPFAGVLTPHGRWRAWRETRERLGLQS